MICRYLILAAFMSPTVALAASSGTSVRPVLDTLNYSQWAVAMVFVVALIIGMGWLLKRFNNFAGAGNSRLKVLSGLSVGGREKVFLIEVAGKRQLVIGVAPGQVETLYVLNDSETIVVEENTPVHPFASKLGALLKEHGK